MTHTADAPSHSTQGFRIRNISHRHRCSWQPPPFLFRLLQLPGVIPGPALEHVLQHGLVGWASSSNPASSSTCRCFETAGSDMWSGPANSPTVTSPSRSRESSPRRVSWAKAAKIRSSISGLGARLMVTGKRRYLTNWLNMTSRNFHVIPKARRSVRDVSHPTDESISFSIPVECQLLANGRAFR
jgi:hypothetical protein